MGLDIRAYKNAERLDLPVSADHDALWDDEGKFNVYGSPDFPERLDGYEPGWYSGEPVLMTTIGERKINGFRAGSYSGYNRWRTLLSVAALGATAKQVWDDPAKFAGQPFVPLIQFSDCDGEIGPKTSALLARDFAEQREKVAANMEDYDQRTYGLFGEAFAAVADNGFVLFR